MQATKLSVNTVYIQLMEKVKPDRVAGLAKKHGLAAELDKGTGVKPGKSPLEKVPVMKPYLPLALGSGDVTTLQLASAFGTWANQGVHHPPYLVEKVVDSNDRVIEQHDRNDPGTAVVHPNVAATINLALRGAVEEGTGTGARLFDRQVAGKTGTTSNYTDARFVGYTPDLVTSVWLGYDDPRHKLYNVHGLERVSGGTLPAQIWRDFMVQATKGMEPRPFPDPQLTGMVLNSTTSVPPTTLSPDPGQGGGPGPGPTFPKPTQPGPGPSLPPPTQQPGPTQP
jgi:penicillin-binding protein 1A